MNLQRWIQNMLADGRAGRVSRRETFFGQKVMLTLKSVQAIMFLPSVRPVTIALCWGLFLSLPSDVFGQTNYYSKLGAESSAIGSMPGDQVLPDAALSFNGGFVVWQDNATDGSGWGISARRLDGTLSGTGSSFRVNQQGTNDQENARVTLLKNGGAAFVWQGGKAGYQHIFARFLTPANTFLTTTDLVVSTFTNNFQINPVAITLNNSNVVIAWGSFNQAGSNSLQDVYAKILSPGGITVSNEFRVNQFSNYNQRTPALAALKDGGYVAVWVSEQQQSVTPNVTTTVNSTDILKPSVDIYARLYASNGSPRGNEFLVTTNGLPAASPAVAAGSDGGFMITWAARNLDNPSESLDIYARSFGVSGNVATGGGNLRVNTYVYGDQYAPRISVNGVEYFIIWSTLGQDGSREGVSGRFVHGPGGVAVGGEFPVNTSSFGRQIHPVVAADNTGQYITLWTGYTGPTSSFDIRSQRYLNVAAMLPAPAAPFVYAPFTLDALGVYQPQLQVSWSPLLGISVSNYEVYVDGAGVPAVVTTNNVWTMSASNGLAASSTHTFQVDYVTTANVISPRSAASSGTAWSGGNYYGIPIEWMQQYYGNSIANWPVNVNAPLSPGGLTLQKVFDSGGSPLDSGTWLRTSLALTSQGMFLNWNTVPGQTYQVQSSSTLGVWTNFGGTRFAAGTNDSIFVGGGSAGFYQVLLLRQ